MSQWPYPQPKTYYDVKSAFNYRIIINQGGTRSGKTFSTVQLLCEWCQSNRGKGYTISIVRKTTPSLKATVYRDFLEILLKENWYDESFHNKSELTYNLFGNLVEFFAVDEPQKVRGRKRHILFINEANELTYEEFFQLNIRTSYKTIIDFNPSDEFLWIYDLELRKDCAFFITNYTHNPHLERGLIEEIELLQQADTDYWRVYGQGLRGASRELILTHWKLIDEMPGIGDRIYGQDFGFNVASPLVAVEILEGCVYVDELMYETKMITSDIAKRYDGLNIDLSAPIYCDAAAADSIEELERYGYNAIKAQKDVKEGLNKLKSMPLYVTRRSHNTIKELRNYKWLLDKKTEKPTEQPVKFNDHAIDAIRYAVYTHLTKPKRWRSYAAA